jgi:hypothetical protein
MPVLILALVALAGFGWIGILARGRRDSGTQTENHPRTRGQGQDTRSELVENRVEVGGIDSGVHGLDRISEQVSPAG